MEVEGLPAPAEDLTVDGGLQEVEMVRWESAGPIRTFDRNRPPVNGHLGIYAFHEDDCWCSLGGQYYCNRDGAIWSCCGLTERYSVCTNQDLDFDEEVNDEDDDKELEQKYRPQIKRIERELRGHNPRQAEELLRNALHQQSPYPVVDLILKAHPDSALYCTHPIHDAIRHGTSVGVARRLLELLPESIKQKDGLGRLPIHMVFYNEKSCTYKLLKFLVDAYPEGIRIPDNGLFLPIHLACRFSAEKRRLRTQLVDCLIKNYPESLSIPARNGALPLHCCASGLMHIGALQKVTEGNPFAVYARDSCGNSPLDLFERSRRGSKELAYLQQVEGYLREVIHESRVALGGVAKCLELGDNILNNIWSFFIPSYADISYSTENP